MVSSRLGTTACKPLQKQLFLHIDSSDVTPSDYLELDFSDVFGPLTAQAPTEMDTSAVAGDSSHLVYNDPVVIHSRSHSLVGPSTCITQSLQLGKLTLNELETTVELTETATDDEVIELKPMPKADSLEGASKDLSIPTEEYDIGLDDFEILKVVGKGAFGKVFQVKKRGTTEIYAMKVVRKDKILEKDHVGYMKAERDILTIIDHPFIVRLRYSFQTKYKLYLVLDFVNGGHLFFQLYHHGLFREDLARIYAAEIVSAVSHLHANGIMHRDLKPENILLDADGHAMLTDFGLAKQFDENTRSNSMCGTLEYMSPEIILGSGHNKAADWWSIGILIFEMLTGKPPFIGGNREKIQHKIIKEKIKLPAFLSSEAHSLLKGLLQKEASKRLGYGVDSSKEVKGHKWFRSINWKRLEARQIQPSFRPNVAGKHCIANFDEKWTNMPLCDSPVATPTDECNFLDFTYIRPASYLQRAEAF